MLESPAYRALSLSGHRILDRLEIEMAHHGGTDNGRLPCTYDDFENYGIHRHSIAPALRETAALGFVEVTERGCAGNAEYRSPNLFRLTYRPTKGIRGDGSHDWRKIESLEQALALSAGNHHRKRHFHSTETTTTGHSTETITTIDISGRGADARRKSLAVRGGS